MPEVTSNRSVNSDVRPHTELPANGKETLLPPTRLARISDHP